MRGLLSNISTHVSYLNYRSIATSVSETSEIDGWEEIGFAGTVRHIPISSACLEQSFFRFRKSPIADPSKFVILGPADLGPASSDFH